MLRKPYRSTSGAARLRLQAAHKWAVAAQHAEGTAYHTRAVREARALEAKADRLERGQ
jgi:hypothetical protein